MTTTSCRSVPGRRGCVSRSAHSRAAPSQPVHRCLGLPAAVPARALCRPAGAGRARDSQDAGQAGGVRNRSRHAAASGDVVRAKCPPGSLDHSRVGERGRSSWRRIRAGRRWLSAGAAFPPRNAVVSRPWGRPSGAQGRGAAGRGRWAAGRASPPRQLGGQQRLPGLRLFRPAHHGGAACAARGTGALDARHVRGHTALASATGAARGRERSRVNELLFEGQRLGRARRLGVSHAFEWAPRFVRLS